jgi:hypothetical protein
VAQPGATYVQPAEAVEQTSKTIVIAARWIETVFIVASPE